MASVLIAGIFAAVAAQMQPTDLVIVCNVTVLGKSPNQDMYKKKFEIDLEPHYYRAYHDQGSGYRLERNGFPHSVSDTRITFVEDGTTQEFYDRKTGEYFFRDNVSRREEAGKCVRANFDRQQAKG